MTQQTGRATTAVSAGANVEDVSSFGAMLHACKQLQESVSKDEVHTHVFLCASQLLSEHSAIAGIGLFVATDEDRLACVDATGLHASLLMNANVQIDSESDFATLLSIPMAATEVFPLHTEGQLSGLLALVSNERLPSSISDAFCLLAIQAEVALNNIALEDRSRQSRRLEALGHLSSGIAHEINTPVQFIGDNLSFVSQAFETVNVLLTEYREVINPDQPSRNWAERVEFVRSAEEAADIEFIQAEVPLAIEQALDGIKRVSTIVRAMKTFGHPDLSEQELVDINDSLETTVVVGKSELKYVADVKLVLGDIPAVRCFKGDINQVILNLLVNAAHAIGDVSEAGTHGMITVNTWNDEQDVYIAISDTGSGIPEHVRTKIFDPYFTTKAVGKGTGQGLALAKNVIVSRHHGSIDFETEIGVGTTFTIRLPIAGIT